MTDFYNARAAKLPPKEAVLFIFNWATGMNVNGFEVDISAPLGYDDQGRVLVDIVGRGTPGPNGDGGYIGTTRFAYRRTPLAVLNLPTDGSFFNVLGSRPSFLGIVNEFIRRTQFNCTVNDFLQIEYRSDGGDGYRLRAHPDSLRFEGEVNLGHPLRSNLDQLIPDGATLDFGAWDGALDLKVDRVPSHYDISAYPQLVSKLVPGYVVSPSDTLLYNVLLAQASYNGVTIHNDLMPNPNLNINGMTVTYNGPLRQSADDKHLFPTRDRVIELVPNPTFAPGAFGVLKMYYSSQALVKPAANSEMVYPLAIFQYAAPVSRSAPFWASVVPGTILDDNGTATVVTASFIDALGLNYDPILQRTLKVVYNGPARPHDYIPKGRPAARVVEMVPVDNVQVYIYGPIKVIY